MAEGPRSLERVEVEEGAEQPRPTSSEDGGPAEGSAVTSPVRSPSAPWHRSCIPHNGL